jgi:hypothetical protein
LQHQRLQQQRWQLEEDEVRRQMFGGVEAFLAALGHVQQVDYGEDTGGLEDCDAGGSDCKVNSPLCRLIRLYC